ncbi:hypothetical protein MITS9504_03505 [Synechococcus sp. MIT S9504]|nr:hypothetical protein MITS9504_03505 [Synechococcus sp. MIT S9504]
MAGQDLGECAFAAAVTAHDRVNFTGSDLEIHAFEDGLILNGCMQIIDVEEKLCVGANHSREGRVK